jgi:hypothetical protein
MILNDAFNESFRQIGVVRPRELASHYLRGGIDTPLAAYCKAEERHPCPIPVPQAVLVTTIEAESFW